jgi:hypothetical protein
MSKSFEISENPLILIDKDFDCRLVQLEGLKLGDDYRNINLPDVVEVYVADYKEPYANFAKRIEQFETGCGFIHMAGHFSFGIKNRKIIEIKLSGKYMDELKNYNDQNIISVYGKPDKWLTDPIMFIDDFIEKANILAYSERKLYFFIDLKTKRIYDIRIGDVDEKFYRKWFSPLKYI